MPRWASHALARTRTSSVNVHSITAAHTPGAWRSWRTPARRADRFRCHQPLRPPSICTVALSLAAWIALLSSGIGVSLRLGEGDFNPSLNCLGPRYWHPGRDPELRGLQRRHQFANHFLRLSHGTPPASRSAHPSGSLS